MQDDSDKVFKKDLDVRAPTPEEAKEEVYRRITSQINHDMIADPDFPGIYNIKVVG